MALGLFPSVVLSSIEPAVAQYNAAARQVIADRGVPSADPVAYPAPSLPPSPAERDAGLTFAPTGDSGRYSAAALPAASRSASSQAAH